MDIFKPPYLGWVFYIASTLPALCVIIGALIQSDLLMSGVLLIVIPIYMIWKNDRIR